MLFLAWFLSFEPSYRELCSISFTSKWIQTSSCRIVFFDLTFFHCCLPYCLCCSSIVAKTREDDVKCKTFGTWGVSALGILLDGFLAARGKVSRKPGRKLISEPIQEEFRVNLIRQRARPAQKTSFVIVVGKNHSDRSLWVLLMMRRRIDRRLVFSASIPERRPFGNTSKQHTVSSSTTHTAKDPGWP